MHSILKDGNYIQYGPKIIPNPNAEGGGGEGGGIPTFNIKIEVYDTSANELVDYKYLETGYFYTNEDAGGYNCFSYIYLSTAPEDHIYKSPVIGGKIVFEGISDITSVGDGENAWLGDFDSGLVRSVSGDAIIQSSEVHITGDCTITLNVIPD